MYSYFKKYIIAIFAIVSILMLMTMTLFQRTENLSHDTLKIGLQSGYPPFEFMNTTGKIVGFDLDVAGLIAEKLNKTLIIKDMEFEGVILSLKQGKIDLIMSGMNITPSRLKEILMVPYHGENLTSLSLIFWNEIPNEVQSIEDIAKLQHSSISVESGGIAEMYMSHHQRIPSKSFQGTVAALMDVRYGKSVANLVEPDVAEYLKKQHPQIKIINVPLPKEENIFGFGIGIKKGNQQLFQQIQQVVHELKRSGELKQLEDKWFKGNQ